MELKGDVNVLLWTAVIVVLLTLLVFSALPVLLDYVRKCKVMRLIPGPGPNYPLVGDALLLKSDAREFFLQMCEFAEDFRSEPLLKLWIGPIPFLIVYHADTLEPFLSTSKHMDKAYLYKFLHPWLGKGLLTSTGEKWRIRRKMITPTFHFAILSEFLEVMNEQSNVLVEKLQKHADGESFDCFIDVTLCVLDIISETAMGRKIEAQSNKDSEYVQAIYKMADFIQNRQTKPWLWSDSLYAYLKEGKEHNKTLNILHTFTDKAILERAEELKKMEVKKGDSDPESEKPKKRSAFLDMLLMATDDAGNKMSYKDIREEVDTFMFEVT
uniref:LOC100036997 protein n=1 Tax=Xenopus laevis TaxID=8355 RepID=A1L3G2_XENLA|nr:LOC100036997 protein [Xenopus laevis]